MQHFSLPFSTGQIIGFVIFAVLITIVVIKTVHQVLDFKRHYFLRRYLFPVSLSNRIQDKYPHLTDYQIHEVTEGLREYFHICITARNKIIAMPSQAVDEAWHEFILHTREYQTFCQKAFGRFLHHTPAEAMKSPLTAQLGIKRAWRIACNRQDIKPHEPSELPDLFGLDKKLEIPDGFYYSLNCKDSLYKDFCATHIGCASGCAGGNMSKTGAGAGGCTGGCGGGCGGG